MTADNAPADQPDPRSPVKHADSTESAGLLLPDLRLQQRDYLLKISQAINARLDLREVLALVIRHAVEMTAGRAGAIALKDDADGLEVVASYQTRADYRDRIDAIIRSSIGDRPDTSNPALVRRLSDAAAPDQVVSLPLKVAGDEIGKVFVIRSEGAAVFTPVDTQLLSAFADQAAVAIQNARMYAEASLRADELQFLNDFSAAMLRAERRGEALEAAARLALRAGPSTAAVVLAFDRAERPPVEVAMVGPSELSASDLVPASRRVLESTGQNAVAGADTPDALRSAGLDAAVAIPVRGASGSRAVLWVGRESTPYPPAAVQLLTTFGQTLGLTLDRFLVLEELAMRQRQLTEVIDHHPSGLLMLDRSAAIRAMNPAAEALLGLDRDTCLGTAFAECAHLVNEAGSPVPLELPASSRDTATTRGYLNGSSKGGKPFVQLSVKAIEGSKVPVDGYLAELVDLSQYKEIEDAKTAFLAGLSHELKTPLSLIRGFGESLTLESVRKDPELAQEALDVILTETDHLTGMVNRLLDAARMEAGEVPLDVDQVDLGQLLDRVVSEFRKLHPGYLWDLTTSDVGVVSADAPRIREVMQNLLSNAVKFSDPPGLIRVEAVGESDKVRVSVTDEGIGLGEADQARLFDRFFRASEKGEGTGLGLYMSRAIVEAHGGSIDVSSKSGRGATFTFTLPR